MYVFNNGVQVVQNGVDGIAPDFCPEGNSCGFFNSSQLEIPFFSNNWNHLPNIKITFNMLENVKSSPEGVISNGCRKHKSYVGSNSFFFAIVKNNSRFGITDANDVRYRLTKSSSSVSNLVIYHSILSLYLICKCMLYLYIQ